MKIVKISMLLVAAAVVIFGLGTTSFAFHSGGVAECMGCHNIHDAQSTSALLMAQDVTSTCANASCHGAPSAGSYHILTPQASMGAGVPPLNKTPGGDFGWLLKDYTWVPRTGTTDTSAAAGHGHNVVALDLAGYVQDPINLTPPGGGTMDATVFSCNSCHDQHGQMRRLSDGSVSTTGAPIIGSGSYTNSTAPAAGQAVGMYRLLRGQYSEAGDGGTTFSANFNAVVASTYNKDEGTSGRTQMAFGAGVSDWCATCHPDMLSATSAKHTHPTNQGFSSVLAAAYNAYVGSGVTGNPDFDTYAPYANDNVTDLATLKADAINQARDASTTSRVMCLSCHRAHASGWDFMARSNMTGNEFVWVEGMFPGTDATGISSQAKYAQGRTVAETAAGYNKKATDVPGYSTYQRSLCNKCHAKD
jgi:hypothetical protein